MMAFIEFERIRKDYHTGDVTITALEDCSFPVEKGELAVILGPSGAGKTTILNLIGGMDIPTGGKIIVDGENIDRYSRRELILYRRNVIGFVFQFYNLIPSLTALENVELACQICPDSLDPVEMLKLVGLEKRLDNFPAQLSGGEQQRVAIARALAKNPKLLLCDEPTGALDSDTGLHVIQILHDICRGLGVTTVLVTHNSVLAPVADRVIHVRNGTVEDMSVNAHPADVKEISW
jgi:putative ABC transport system ATP-binding protein